MIEKFRNKVYFVDITGTSDGIGGLNGENASTAQYVWARIRKAKQSELYMLDKPTTSTPLMVKIRYYDLPNSNMTLRTKLVYKGKRYNVISSTSDEYDRFVEMICVKDD